MALSNAQYQSIIHGYEVTQLNNHRIMEERLQEVNSHVDGFKELSASIASVSVSQGRKLLDGDDSALTDLRDTIRRLSGMGKVIFVVTHDYEFVCRTCTRVLHLDGGGIRDDFSVTKELLPTMKKIFDVR